MIDAPADIIDRYFLQPFQLVSSKEIPDEAPGQSFLLDLMQITMGHIYDHDMLPIFKEKLIDSLSAAEKHGRQDLISTVLYYVISTGEVSDINAFYSLIDSQLSPKTGDEVMTLAQQWLEEGRQKEKLIIAASMLKQKCSIELIAQITGLSPEKIYSLKKINREDDLV